jgi:hypothetical protein
VPKLAAFLSLTFLAALAACSNSEAPSSSLGLAPSYHLKTVDGVPLPIRDASGESLDSGRVLRLAGDTVRVDDYSHLPASGGNPGIGTIRLGTWVASQSGNVVALRPVTASSQDTAFLASDTLTLHTHPVSSLLQVNVYVAP